MEKFTWEKRQSEGYEGYVRIFGLNALPCEQNFELQGEQPGPLSLNHQEKDWLNNYHKDVYEKLSPFLTTEEQEWLKEYTKAI